MTKRYLNCGSTVTINDAKVILESITKYNNDLVSNPVGDKTALRQHLRHERIYQMMQSGELLSKNNALWHYLVHFKSDRAQKIGIMTESSADDKRLVGPKSKDYNAAYLEEYFANKAADNS